MNPDKAGIFSGTVTQEIFRLTGYDKGVLGKRLTAKQPRLPVLD